MSGSPGDELVVHCAGCGARYAVARSTLDAAGPAESGLPQGGSTIPRGLGEDVLAHLWLLCSGCGHVGRAAAVRTVGDGAGEETAALRTLREAQLPRVVVGHEVPAAARSIASVLRQAGYAPVIVRSGEQVLAACDPAMPSPAVAVALDVAIPGVMAFEVIDQLRATNGAELPVVLLASVFERTRYKRRPNSLYGADAYLELHHVPDRLIPLLDEIRQKRSPQTEHLQAPVERARAAALRNAGSISGDEAAAALARRLLSDVALYHGDELAAGVRTGDPLGRVASAVSAAREIFVTASVPAKIFDDEVRRFENRLLERHRAAAAPGGAPNG